MSPKGLAPRRKLLNPLGYDLARELGYCSGQEVRDGEQWINLSGSWEQWEAAVKRGYSLGYLKKIMKRNRS